MRDDWLPQLAVCQPLIHPTDNKVLLKKECGPGHRWLRRHSLPLSGFKTAGEQMLHMCLPDLESIHLKCILAGRV